MMKIITFKKKQEIIINIENWCINSYTKIMINNEYQLKYTDHLIYDCQNCGKEAIIRDKTKFDKFNVNKFLCNKCSHEETNIERYGVKNVAQNRCNGNQQPSIVEQRRLFRRNH